MSYERQGPPKPIGDKPEKTNMPGRKGESRFSLRLAEVVRVDYEHMNCDLKFLHTSVPAREVPITSAFWSRRGFLGAMPEKGAIAVCGFADVHQGQGVRPYILSFLPNGFRTALRYHPFNATEREAEEVADKSIEELQKELEDIYSPIRHKFRKLYPGDIYATSSKGSELLMDRGVHIFDREGQELWMRPDDHAFILNAMDLDLRTASSRRASGRVVRSDLFLPTDVLNGASTVDEDHPLFGELRDAGLIDESGAPVEDVGSIPSYTTSSGREVGIITRGGVAPDDRTAEAYTEDRFQLTEYTDQIMQTGGGPDYDADRLGSESAFDTFIERVYGTVVGADAYSLSGRSRYGKVLKPSLFSSRDASSGTPRLDVLDRERDRGSSAAAAFLYRMKRPDDRGELFVSHDKEGRIYMSVPASTSRGSGNGAGRSMDAEFRGAVKTTMGADRSRNESLDMTTEGGWNATIGALAGSNRSIDASTAGGIHVEVDRGDQDGRAVDLRLSGDSVRSVDGDDRSRVTGDSISEVGGAFEVSSESMTVSVGQGNIDVSTAGRRTTTIKGSDEATIGSGRVTKIKSPKTGSTLADELKIVLGSRRETFTAPAQDERVFVAAGTRSITAGGALNATWSSGVTGNYSFTAPSGAFSVNMGAGAISMNTGGAVTITAGASVQVTSPAIGLTGTVGLGDGLSAENAVVGGVPGPSPYLDPITGLPATGNPQVRTV